MARSRRRSRFRSTAPPTARFTAKATRAPGAAGSCKDVTVTGPDRFRAPLRRSAPKVRRSRTRPTARARGEDRRATAPPLGAESGRQTVAALVTARLEDGPARPSGHAVPEAVSLRSFADVWLIGALHCFLFCGAEVRASPRWRLLARFRCADQSAILCRARRHARGRSPDQAIHQTGLFAATTPFSTRKNRGIDPLDACGQGATVPGPRTE